MSPNIHPTEVQNEVVEDTDNLPKQNLEILYDGYFYDVTEFIRRHPGGNVIKFYTEKGEDATVPVQQFHYRMLPKVLGTMKSLKKRPASPEELESVIPKSEMGRHKALTEDFQKLKEELEEEGYFVPSIPHVILRWTEILFWAALSLYFSNIGWKWTCSVFVGICGARAGMLHHEAGHYSMTGRAGVDKFLGALVFGLFAGMSTSWWKSQHNRHHAMPQRLQHDVDLETMPFIAFNKLVVRDAKDGKSFMIRYQKYLFSTLDCAVMILHWKLWLHPRYVIKKGKHLELFFLVLSHYILFFVLKLSFMQYWMAYWIFAVYVLGIFSMNHSHLDVTSDNLHWVEYCFVHTVDVSAHWAVDIWMSFLNYQIEHHLFPAMPQFRQRRIKDRVRALAERHGLPYRTLGFWEALKTVYRNLGEVAESFDDKNK